MKQFLLMIAVALVGCGESAEEKPTGELTDDSITDPIVRAVLAKSLKKPTGKFAPPPKFTKAELASVTSLNLNDLKITDAGLKEMAKLQQLTELELVNTKITDAGLKDIAKLQNLTELWMGGTKITDACLRDIAKLQQLTYLHLYDTKITDEGAAELRKALPKCIINHRYKKD